MKKFKKLTSLQRIKVFASAIFLTSLHMVFSGTVLAQIKPISPPIPIELVFGHEQLNFQMIVKKKFAPESKFDLSDTNEDKIVSGNSGFN